MTTRTNDEGNIQDDPSEIEGLEVELPPLTGRRTHPEGPREASPMEATGVSCPGAADSSSPAPERCSLSLLPSPLRCRERPKCQVLETCIAAWLPMALVRVPRYVKLLLLLLLRR